jgi:serine/threonine-protein kinase
MPLDEALPIARQIAEALEAAHEQGIIHRDLKPANIKVRTDGTVKVLDFGLAKALEQGSGIGDRGSGLANSPTITSPAMTQAGMILGTAAYMAPEQAKGRAVDKRADIFAFGAVLYEMLTGTRAFQGEDVTDLIVAVVSKEPDWAALSPSTSLSVRSTLRRCLEKDPKRRLRDIGEARLALDGASDPAPSPERQKARPIAWAPAAIAVLSLAVAALVWWTRPATEEKRSARLNISIPPGAEITSFPAITRDGRTVAYVSQQGAEDAQLYLRDLNAFEARSVAFSSSLYDSSTSSPGRLLVVDPSASVRAAPFDPAHPAPTSTDATVLEDVHFDVETEIAAWLAVSNTGTAVYAPGNPARTSLVWVDQTGKIESLGLAQDIYRESTISPDGTKAVVRHGLDLWIHDLRRGTRNPLTSGDASNLLPQWTRDGLRIVFASNRGGDWDIYSQPADASRPAEVLLKQPNDQFPYSILADGTLIFTEIQAKTGRDIWMLSPGGKPSPVRVTPFNELAPQFSPGPVGGRRWVAYASDESGRSEVYVQSYPGGENRIPVSTGGGTVPMWSPDGKEIFYLSPDAVMAVTMQPDGAVGAPRRLFDRSPFLINDRVHSYGVSADGKRFLMIQRDAGSVPRQLNVILNWRRTEASGADEIAAREQYADPD